MHIEIENRSESQDCNTIGSQVLANTLDSYLEVDCNIQTASRLLDIEYLELDRGMEVEHPVLDTDMKVGHYVQDTEMEVEHLVLDTGMLVGLQDNVVLHKWIGHFQQQRDRNNLHCCYQWDPRYQSKFHHQDL